VQNVIRGWVKNAKQKECRVDKVQRVEIFCFGCHSRKWDRRGRGLPRGKPPLCEGIRRGHKHPFHLTSSHTHLSQSKPSHFLRPTNINGTHTFLVTEPHSQSLYIVLFFRIPLRKHSGMNYASFFTPLKYRVRKSIDWKNSNILFNYLQLCLLIFL